MKRRFLSLISRTTSRRGIKTGCALGLHARRNAGTPIGMTRPRTCTVALLATLAAGVALAVAFAAEQWGGLVPCALCLCRALAVSHRRRARPDRDAAAARARRARAGAAAADRAGRRRRSRWSMSASSRGSGPARCRSARRRIWRAARSPTGWRAMPDAPPSPATIRPILCPGLPVSLATMNLDLRPGVRGGAGHLSCRRSQRGDERGGDDGQACGCPAIRPPRDWWSGSSAWTMPANTAPRGSTQGQLAVLRRQRQGAADARTCRRRSRCTSTRSRS